VSAAGDGARGGRATRAALGRKATLGSGAVMGCGGKLGQKEKRRVEEIKEKLFIFKKNIQTNEFKQKFEFKHSKQCTSMYATGNSYISLLN
jgi:hypothetical protein